MRQRDSKHTLQTLKIRRFSILSSGKQLPVFPALFHTCAFTLLWYDQYILSLSKMQEGFSQGTLFFADLVSFTYFLCTQSFSIPMFLLLLSVPHPTGHRKKRPKHLLRALDRQGIY